MHLRIIAGLKKFLAHYRVNNPRARAGPNGRVQSFIADELYGRAVARFEPETKAHRRTSGREWLRTLGTDILIYARGRARLQ